MYDTGSDGGGGGGDVAEGEEEGGEDMAVDGPSTAAGNATATKSRDSAGSRKRKHGGEEGSEGSDADTAAAGGGGGGMAAAPGFVEVCGLELPRRHEVPGSGGSAGGAPPLVHTPTVDRNLEALALGESGWVCGGRGRGWKGWAGRSWVQGAIGRLLGALFRPPAARCRSWAIC